MSKDDEKIVAEIEKILGRLPYDQLCLVLAFALQLL